MRRTKPELSKAKQFAVDAVARHFSADRQVGEGPPDAYATLRGRRIALDVAIIPHLSRARPVSKPRLREDRVAQRVLRDIVGALRTHVPNGKTLVFTLGAPIKVPKQLIVALTKLLLDWVQRGGDGRENRKTVLGNRVRFSMLKQDLKRNSNVIGLVFSGDPYPGVLASAMRSLHEEITSKAQRRMPKGFAGDRWLILSSDAWIADIKTYRLMYSHLSVPSSFEKILMASADGKVEPLT